MWFRFILPILVLIIVAISILFITLKSTANYRLNKNVKPLKYDIQIQPYLLSTDGPKLFTFEGEVNITLQATKDLIKQFSVHTNEINIKSIRLYDKFQNEIQNFKDKEMIYNSLNKQLHLNLLEPLQWDRNYTLYIKYSGGIRNDSYGLFRFSYDNLSCQALTLFQPLGARLVLPCFDEPEFKAKFGMSIIRPRNYKSYFNTKLLRTVRKGIDYEMDLFDYTPLMSSYLLAFMITNYISYGDNEIQMITATELINETYFSYKVAKRSIQFYNKYFAVQYKQLGNSLMQISFTNKYKYLALENWGLIVFRDSIILQVPDYTDGWIDKQKCIGTIIHEMAHMWFGNSVTLKWWSYFWLNEAFARYYEIVIADLLYPSYEFEQQFVVNKLHSILDIDATSDSLPMTSNEESVNTPSEIASKLNRITYDKGASVLRMFSNAMGRDNFNMAMRDYLKENHLKNTIPKDVFKYLRRYWPKTHKVNLEIFFQDWTQQSGYPMLIISTTNQGEYLLKQQRFLKNNRNLKHSSLTYTIPITYATDKEKNFENLTPKFYFNKTVSQLKFGNVNQNKWLILNLQQSNYCRVFYSSLLLEKLREALMAHNHSDIHVINRASLIDDLFSFANIGLVSYNKVFYFMEYLAKETEYLPWRAAFKGFNSICKRFSAEQHKHFTVFLFKLLDLVYGKLGFESNNDSVLDVYKRNHIIQWLCKYHHHDCNIKAQYIFRLHLLANTKPNPDFRETLYCAACRKGNSEIYENLTRMFLNYSLISEKEKVLQAMACSQHNVKMFYKFLLSNNVALNLKIIGLRGLFSQNFENILPVFQLMIENIEQLAKALQEWRVAASVICDISSYLTTKDQLSMLKDFVKYKGSLFGKSLKILKQCIITAEKNLNWSNKYLLELFT
ncbi:membrane alanyl aminopeptidase-like [Calliphora vicina]|uniref:membrane alanyl aminopeptidase-like n=1 Tax=Calliphora vicina TaxID=7373 RepID=UPI00325BE6CF